MMNEIPSFGWILELLSHLSCMMNTCSNKNMYYKHYSSCKICLKYGQVFWMTLNVSGFKKYHEWNTEISRYSPSPWKQKTSCLLSDSFTLTVNGFTSLYNVSDCRPLYSTTREVQGPHGEVRRGRFAGKMMLLVWKGVLRADSSV